MIAHDRQIAENTASDYMKRLFSNQAIVYDRQRVYGNSFQRSGDHRRSRVIIRFSIVSRGRLVRKLGECRCFMSLLSRDIDHAHILQDGGRSSVCFTGAQVSK